MRAARRTDVDRTARDRPGSYVSQRDAQLKRLNWLPDIRNRRYFPLPLMNIRVFITFQLIVSQLLVVVTVPSGPTLIVPMAITEVGFYTLSFDSLLEIHEYV